jgi:predicted site-specific integrase-resolvase
MKKKRRNEQDVEIQFYRRRGAAMSIGVSERCLSNWTQRGLIPVIKVGKRCVLYSRADIEAALRRFRIGAIGEES